MKYSNTTTAVFLHRPNRFTAQVLLDNKAVIVHIKNTGRCRELLVPGAKVTLARGAGSNRKTQYDLISVFKEGLGWVNIDSQACNIAAAEWLKSHPEPFGDVQLIRPEYVFGSSRIDFYLEAPGRKILMEVKGCTLERNGTGYFPDAPTERGIKHLNELSAAAESGYACFLAFVIAMPGVRQVLPNLETHPEFGAALAEAQSAGVRILYLCCDVSPDSLVITGCVQPQSNPYR